MILKCKQIFKEIRYGINYMTIATVSYDFMAERMLFTTDNLIPLLMHFLLNDNFNCLE